MQPFQEGGPVGFGDDDAVVVVDDKASCMNGKIVPHPIVAMTWMAWREILGTPTPSYAVFQFLVARVVVRCGDEGCEQRVLVVRVGDGSADADVNALAGVVWGSHSTADAGLVFLISSASGQWVTAKTVSYVVELAGPPGDLEAILLESLPVAPEPSVFDIGKAFLEDPFQRFVVNNDVKVFYAEQKVSAFFDGEEDA